MINTTIDGQQQTIRSGTCLINGTLIAQRDVDLYFTNDEEAFEADQCYQGTILTIMQTHCAGQTFGLGDYRRAGVLLTLQQQQIEVMELVGVNHMNYVISPPDFKKTAGR